MDKIFRVYFTFLFQSIYMLKILFITFFMTLISGCVTNAEISEDQLAEDSQEKLICESEKEIDSDMEVEKCLTQAELDKLEERAKKKKQSEQRRRARMGS